MTKRNTKKKYQKPFLNKKEEKEQRKYQKWMEKRGEGWLFNG